MITNEKFAEVLKSLTKEDFDAVQKIISKLYDKFDDLSTREMFTEKEIEKISNLLESYSYSDEVKLITLMSKFKVSDKVRVVMSDEIYGLHKGAVHTVVSVHPMGNIELKGIDVIQWSPDRFELVQENTTTIQATAKRKDDDLFTPDCLVGVETNYGYITSVLSISFGSSGYFKPSLYVYTTESLSEEDLKDVHNLKYYISDESDETVSFTDYVNMFYDGWYNENEIKS